jgi:serine/threonine protein kinase
MLIDLLTVLLEKDPDVRISVQDVLEHPWMETKDKANRFDSRIKDQGIDIALVQELTSQCGIQWQQLKESLMAKRYDANTAVYRIRRRPKAIAAYRETSTMEELPQTVSFAVAPQPMPLPRGILEQDGWRSRLRKDLVRCNSVQAGPKVVQPTVKK